MAIKWRPLHVAVIFVQMTELLEVQIHRNEIDGYQIEFGRGQVVIYCITLQHYYIISHHLFSFRGSLQDYKIHKDMEIAILN